MKKLIILFSIFLFAFASGCSKETTSGETDIKRIAVICDSIGVNPFLTQIVDKFAEIKESNKYPMEYQIIESRDSAAWSENIRAAVEEGYDLILAVGWQSADSMKEISTLFPDRAEYVVIDTVVDSPNVKSYIFKSVEGAYLVGVIAALVSADAGKPDGPFGGVHANPGQGSFEWRYGYMEGVRSINPNVEISDFVFNYTKSYSDASLAKELANQQVALGCVFINAASAVADFGTFESAKENGFYTSGQDFDRTSADNPNVITTQTKYTGVIAEMIVDEFFTTGMSSGVVSMGIKEGVVGAVYITDDGINPRNRDVLTDKIVETAKEAAERIKSGEVNLIVPLEADYK